MSATALPYTVKPHPVTDMYSGKFGTWLFLASEVMLFGALFSSYVFLRVGSPTEGAAAWPSGAETHLSWKIGGFNTFVLIVSSVTMVMAWASLKAGQFGRARAYLAATASLGLVFLIIKLAFEYQPHWQAGDVPAKSIFFGLYYVMTGLHGLHVIGGVLVMAYLLGPGLAMWNHDAARYTNRVECTGLYWHFVDLVWIFLFPTLYLMN